MKKLLTIVAGILVSIVVSYFFNKAHAQVKSGLLNTASEHTIKSGFNGKEYVLYVSTPKNYSPSGSQRYPVLYVLDGRYSFTAFHSSRELMDLGKELKDFILVAIENNYDNDTDWLAGRYTDFTPTRLPAVDEQWEKMMQLPQGRLKSGGATAFLNTIEKDIIPYIEKSYLVSQDRGLSGHSIGGLFATYCFITRPALFSKYGLNSPSLWWNGNEMLTLFNAQTSSASAMEVQVFLSIGGMEGDMMTAPYTAFQTSLLQHHLPWVQLSDHTFEGESHLSVVSASSSRTLKVFYSQVK